MLKILHIITRIDRGGSSRNVISTIKGLLNYDNYLIYGKSQNPEDISSLNLEKCFQINSLIRDISPIKDLIAFFKIYSILNKIQPDIIHTHTSKAGFLGRLAALLYKLKNKKVIIVHTPHGHLLYGYFGKIKTFFFIKIEQILSKITDYFIALTPQEKQESSKAKIGSLEKWEVIHSGIEFPSVKPDKESIRQKLQISRNEFLIGTCGRFEKVKGMEIFIRAIIIFENKYKPQNVKYMMVGDGSEREKLERMVLGKKLEEKFIFTGFQNDVYEYLTAMDLLVQPSLNEAMGRTVLEAQFCGVPVIVSDACGLPSTMKDGKTGLIFKRGDYKELAEKINMLYTDRIRLENFSANAIRFVNETNSQGYRIFSDKAMNYELSKFYAKIKLKLIKNG